MSTSPPMGLNPEEIPQIVFLTFDDALNYWMYPTYQKILGKRTNPNGKIFIPRFENNLLKITKST